ncbi:Cilia- and flagella-associated protein 44 [Nowakowskiella sp. JEL0407]|nr:Cilia- and flagella-associated protein 44 [Nowakowskiella sp. JEL0407]
MEQKYVEGFRDGSIGAIAVHPSRKYIAIAETYQSSPNIYIIEYPSFRLFRILRDGTTRLYSDICFNPSGDKIASVGGDPDFMLTIWNWKSEKVILRSKAFSQDVFKVAFSPDSDGILTTSGMGHIRFWKMALTFTGLKLQGFIGKFGTSELTDISAFVQLPDGKVLSSTETGNLLLWDGGMIKCEIAGKGKKPCHQGRIDVIFLVEQEIITAGDDGVIRIWDVETIDNADVTTGDQAGQGSSTLQARVFELEPVDEIQLGKDVKVKSMVKCVGSSHEYLIQDSIGHIFKLDTTKRTTDKLLSFHSGPVTGIDTSPIGHSMASFGSDGTIRVYDYISKQSLGKVKYTGMGTALTYFPPSVDRLGCTLAAGFSDGVLRIVTHSPIRTGNPTPPTFYLQYVFKPHNNKPITSISISADGKFLATSSPDNTVFLFKIEVAKANPDPQNAYEVSAALEAEEKKRAYFDFYRDTVKISPIGFFSVDFPVVNVLFSPDNHANVAEFEGGSETESNKDDLEEEENQMDKTDSKSETSDEVVNENQNPATEAEKSLETGQKMLIVLQSGELMSLVLPDTNKINTTLSYEISKDLLSVSQWKLVLPPKPSPVTVAVENKNETATEENMNDEVTTESEQRKSITAKQDTQKQATATKTEESKEKMIVMLRKARGLTIAEDCAITNAIYLEGGYVIIALVNKSGDGEIRACKINSPEISRLLLVYKSAFTDLRLSRSGKYLLIGSCDGMSCLRKFKVKDVLLNKWTDGHETFESYFERLKQELQSSVDKRSAARDIESRDSDRQKQETLDPTASLESISKISYEEESEILGHYWFGYAHSCENGRVNAINTAWDDSFICTGGNEGGIFTFRVNPEVIQRAEEWLDPDIESNMESKIEQVEDITDPAAYSIQESKLTSEKDRELEEAEAKKQATRNYIRDLRNEFLSLLSENEAMPPELRLERSFFSVDTDLKSNIDKETAQKIMNVKKELEWISEKESIGPNKLKKKFLDRIQTERIEILAFNKNCSVATFRTMKLETSVDSTFQTVLGADKNANKQLKDEKDLTQLITKQGNSEGHSEQLTDQNNKKFPKNVDPKSKLEARKLFRAERQAKYKKLLESKPDEKYEDPRDVAAIRYAENHMGDYKLKTGEKYIVPESERVDADKKKRQIVLLKESIYTLKEQFNSQILRLREEKVSLVNYYNNSYNVLKEINEKLLEFGVTLEPTPETMKVEDCAFPENRYIITPEDIEQLKQQDLASATQPRNNLDDIMGAFGSGNQESAPQPKETMVVVDSNSEKVAPTTTTKDAATNEVVADDKKKLITKSGLEVREDDRKRKELIFERDMIKKRLNQRIVEFDDVLEILSKQRAHLEGELKFADMKLLLLYREWALLKEFEKHDNFLAEKLVAKKSEKNEIDSKIKECQEKLNAKKTEIEQIIRKEKEIQEEFQNSVIGENNKYEEFLIKIFRKKIKRTKKKVKNDNANKSDEDNPNQDETDETESETEDEMDDSDNDSDGSENEDEVEEVCPSDLDVNLWNKVRNLRELKLDQEDILVEVQKVIEALKKENDALIKKEKIIDVSLKNAESEIQDFQTQKQQKLNELDVTVPLRLHQIQHLEKNGLPSNLSSVLIFSNEGLVKLKGRIKEVQQEKIDIRKQHKELRKMHVNLIKSKKDKQIKLQELEAKAEDVQRLKFGQIVDLEKLERMGVNKNADELREKLQKEDEKRARELEMWTNKINKLKEEVTEVTKENTANLENLVELMEQKRRLEESLNLSQSSVTTEYSGPKKKDMLEHSKLISLVNSQAEEIRVLRAEIETLIRKPVRLPSIPAPKIPLPPQHPQSKRSSVVGGARVLKKINSEVVDEKSIQNIEVNDAIIREEETEREELPSNTGAEQKQPIVEIPRETLEDRAEPYEDNVDNTVKQPDIVSETEAMQAANESPHIDQEASDVPIENIMTDSAQIETVENNAMEDSILNEKQEDLGIKVSEEEELLNADDNLVNNEEDENSNIPGAPAEEANESTE